MDLDTAIGELILGRVQGTQLDADNRDALKAGLMSGVTLFKDNVSSLEQLLHLVAAVKEASQVRAIVTVDQEGGAVQRFDDIVTELPSAMSLGALGNKAAHDIAEISAKELKLLGINCVLSPVLDVATNPRNPIIATRAYGSSVQLVAQMGALTAATFLEHNVLPVAKHFPGHGDTGQDSHTDLPALNFDRERLDKVELAPFVACLPALPAVLTAHVWLTEFESEPLPASLSKRITTGLLRETLGFNGLVFTDDMLMKAITDRWGLADACVLALIAGADQLLVCTDAGAVRAVHAAVKKAVSDGRLSEGRIYESVARRRHAMQIAGIDVDGNTDKLTSAERLQLFAQMLPYNGSTTFSLACAASTLVRGDLPDLSEGSKWSVVVPDHPRYRLQLADELKKAQVQRKVSITEQRFPLDPDDADIATAVKKLSAAGGSCILLTYKGLRNPGQIKLAHALAESSLANTVIATDVPEDLLHLPEWPNAIATCDPSPLSMRALAQVLVGQARPAGSYQMAPAIESLAQK